MQTSDKIFSSIEENQAKDIITKHQDHHQNILSKDFYPKIAQINLKIQAGLLNRRKSRNKLFLSEIEKRSMQNVILENENYGPFVNKRISESLRGESFDEFR